MKKLLIFLTAAVLLIACNSNSNKESATDSSAPVVAAEWEVVTLPVKGMHCEGCEKAIKAGVGSLDGIDSVESSFEEGWTKVKFDKKRTSLSEIAGKIAEVGYEVVEEKGAMEEKDVMEEKGEVVEEKGEVVEEKEEVVEEKEADALQTD